MKTLKLITSTLAIILLQLFTPTASSANDSRTEVMKLEQQMEERITPIIRFFDPSAFVVIQIRPQQTRAIVLPGTAYTVQNLLVKNQNQFFEVEKTEITVFGKDKATLANAIPVIKKFANRFGINPEVVVNEYAAPAKTIEKKDENIFSKQIFEFAKNTLTNFRYAAGIAMGGTFFFLMILLFAINKATGKLVSSLHQGLQDVNSSARPNDEMNDQYRSLQNEASALPTNYSESTSRSSLDFSDYSDEAYLACLSDCYWGEFDSYASFLWKRIPVAKRSSVLKNASELAPYLNDYVYFIANLPERDLSAIDDPSYLNPLPIFHLNNTELTKLVRKTQALAFSLSSLRLKGLALTLTEKVELRSIQPEKISSANINFKLITASVLRQFSRHMAIEIENVDEESELVHLKEVSIEIIQEIPSLVWSLRLSHEVLEELLKGFSAKELAMAWIGPEEVLQHLSRCIAPKKLELLDSLQKKIIPNRHSGSFKALHDAITKKLTTGEEVVDISVSEDKAA